MYICMWEIICKWQKGYHELRTTKDKKNLLQDPSQGHMSLKVSFGQMFLLQCLRVMDMD